MKADKVEPSLERDTAEREKKYVRLNKMITKRSDLQMRIYNLRFDDSREDEDKEMDLKELLDNLYDLESSILVELGSTTETIIKQLSLKGIGAENIFDDWKKSNIESTRTQSKLSPSPSSPRGSLVNTTSGGLGRNQLRQEEVPFYRPTSTKNLETQQSTKKRGPINVLLRSLTATSDEADKMTELEQIEQDLSNLRAALVSMEEKKNPSKTQLRMIEDIREQLKAKTAQKEKFFRDQYKLDKEGDEKKVQKEGQKGKGKEKDKDDETLLAVSLDD